ncbi:MAG: NAD-dependent malic enzyme [Actinomycetota bacterium]
MKAKDINHNDVRGAALLRDPLRNKDCAFTEEERDRLGLHGLLPPQVLTIEEQVALEIEHLRRKNDDLERFIGLAALRDRNETLFYRLLVDHLEELLPIVYTPVVGSACQQFSHIMRAPRGLWITADDIDRIPTLLRNAARGEVRLIVATDNERILGLGDQGAGGMGIPIGKLSIYSAGAGIHPALTLPISLDVGTDNEALLKDPLYLGVRRPRLRGEEYDRLLDAFVAAVHEVFPSAVLQWEDLKQHTALRVLDRYRDKHLTFNDDIQGTGAVILGGMIAALRKLGRKLAGQRVVMAGAGAAGIGIARAITTGMREEGASDLDIKRSIVFFASRGLVTTDREWLATDQEPFALTPEDLSALGLSQDDPLEVVVGTVKPTFLIGTTGKAGLFTEAVVRAMAAGTDVPVILPLSNPTSKTEVLPEDVLRWTDGRAIVATGSPFPPVEWNGETRIIGQANNAFVFPGVGLGTLVASARAVTDGMFLAAAHAFANFVPDERLAAGAIYPSQQDLRKASKVVAAAVLRRARDEGVGLPFADEDVEPAIEAAMWEPAYAPAYDHVEQPHAAARAR